MTDTIGISNLASGASTLRTAQPSSPAVAETATIEAEPLKQNQNPGISPRIVVDPLAGVITQFLNGDGQVETQIPSSAVVAYLRVGLTPEGLSKEPTKIA